MPNSPSANFRRGIAHQVESLHVLHLAHDPAEAFCFVITLTPSPREIFRHFPPFLQRQLTSLRWGILVVKSLLSGLVLMLMFLPFPLRMFNLRLEKHLAFGAGSGFILLHLGMHGTNVNYLLSSRSFSFEQHPALGTFARLVLLHFRVHRTGVGDLFRCARLPSRGFPSLRWGRHHCC